MAWESRGQFVLSIDLELLARAGSLEHQRQLDLLTGRLLNLLDRHQVPATFAVADPVHSAATEAILSSSRHEVAILGDATWVGRGAGRERFGRELERRFQSALASGLDVSSLVLRQVELGENFDLLMKQPISAIRSAGLQRGLLNQPQLLRFGMWQMPVTLSWPQTSRWFHRPLSVARKLLRQATRRGEVMHVAFDAGQFIESDQPKLGDIERLIAAVAALRDAHHIDVATLQTLGRTLDRPHDTTPLRSILRAA